MTLYITVLREAAVIEDFHYLNWAKLVGVWPVLRIPDRVRDMWKVTFEELAGNPGFGPAVRDLQLGTPWSFHRPGLPPGGLRSACGQPLGHPRVYAIPAYVDMASPLGEAVGPPCVCCRPSRRQRSGEVEQTALIETPPGSSHFLKLIGQPAHFLGPTLRGLAPMMDGAPSRLDAASNTETMRSRKYVCLVCELSLPQFLYEILDGR